MEPRVDEEPAAVSGKENLPMTGKGLFFGTQIVCPVWTSSAFAIGEQPEIRAYKLGKQKCSYNQVELLIKDMYSKEPGLQVSEATETAVGADVDDLLKESCLKFNVRFVNNARLHLYIYVVYASPYCSMPVGEWKQYYWVPVTRSKCRKGCKGPVIRGLQRFGRMSRRVGNTNSHQAFAEPGGQEHIANAAHSGGSSTSYFAAGDSWKEPRHLYIAIDEASTHVCPRPQTSKFRLLVAAYDDQNQLLGSSVSSCIRVLANNDAPLGAASFKLLCQIKGMEKSTNILPCMLLPSGSGKDKKQYGRLPLQEMSQINVGPSEEATKVTTIQAANVLWSKDLEACPHGDEQLHNADSPSSSSCSDEAVMNEDTNSLNNLCQRTFEACSSKQQRVVALRKIATILGASRTLLLEIFSVLSAIRVVEELGKEKYLWLGSCSVEGALQELLVNQRKMKLSTAKDCKDGVDTDCQISSISELGKSFCLLFLSNKSAEIKWEFALEALLDKIQGHKRECLRTTLWKIGVIFSSLNLIVSKRGPVFQWYGSKGVAAHLNSIAQPWPTKRKKIDLEEMEGDCFAEEKDELSSLFNQVQVCRSLNGKRSRLSLVQPVNTCDSDVGETSRVSHSNSAMKCTSVGSRKMEHQHSFEKLQLKRENSSHPSSTELCCQKCIKYLQNSFKRIISEDENEHEGKNETHEAPEPKSTHCTKTEARPCYLSSPSDEAQPCYLLSPGQHRLPLTWYEPVAESCLNNEVADCKERKARRLRDCTLPSFSCLVSNMGCSQLITQNAPSEHVPLNVHWRFDPLASLSSIYAPQQVIFLQQRNPGFLINFVRYYRQLYHKFGCKTDAQVHWPLAVRQK